MKVIINGSEYEYKPKTTLEEISKDFPGDYYCATVNNRIRELSYQLETEGANVMFFGLDYYESVKIYEASLRYVIAMAVSNVFPKENVRFSNSISMGIYGQILNKEVTPEMLDILNNEISRIIKADYRFERRKYDKKTIKQYYKSLGYFDKLGTLKYRKESVNVYEVNGYKNYMYSYMVPSTGYLKNFKLRLYYPGFIIQFPRSEMKGEIPEFSDEPKFLKTLADANEWAKNTGSENIYQINDKCSDDEELIKFIGVCETRHNHQLKEIGDKVQKNLDQIRLIAIAGPSSSGKTTFSKRLEIELLSRNIHPMRISIDNYYLDEAHVPLDENGNKDFEHIEALNLKLFNENMTDFLMGKEVRTPIFDFKTKKVTFSEPQKLSKDGVIIIEGIHALNERLTESIPKNRKFKIYIAPLAQRNIDNHNPISLTDLRLVRRIVRDLNFRNTSAEKTLEMWQSVRNGEHRWIYPYMESADYIFNSELGYELLMLKKYGVESLKVIKNDSQYYILANRLLKFLKVFRSISDSKVKNDSLLREFIGGSVFKD